MSTSSNTKEKYSSSLSSYLTRNNPNIDHIAHQHSIISESTSISDKSHSSDNMRRRKDNVSASLRNPNSPIEFRKNNSNGQGQGGYFAKSPSSKDTIRRIPATMSADDELDTHPHILIPTISDFMPADQQYVQFLLSGKKKNYNSRNRTSVRIHHANQQIGTPTHLQLSGFCTIFSFIAMLLLILFGTMIEVQPLYIKGISPARKPIVRNLHGEYTAYSWVHFSSRLRLLKEFGSAYNERGEDQQHDSISSISHLNKNEIVENQRLLKNMNFEFEMKSEAKVAFKAAALYFLFMVFSFIYTQNHILIGAKILAYRNGKGVLGKIVILIGSIGHVINLIYNQYRRRHYRNVQEAKAGRGVNVMMNRHHHMVHSGSLGVFPAQNQQTRMNDEGEDSDDVEISDGTGLSLRQRDPGNEQIDSTPGGMDLGGSGFMTWNLKSKKR